MTQVSLIVMVLSIVGIAASWGVAVHAGTLAEEARGPVSLGRRVLLILWPFLSRGRLDPTSVYGRRANKAQVALIVSVLVAVAAASVHSNLTHVRPVKAASAVAPAPSKS